MNIECNNIELDLTKLTLNICKHDDGVVLKFKDSVPYGENINIKLSVEQYESLKDETQN